MQPDSTWSGIVVPILAHAFPKIPAWILTLVVGTVVSIVYGFFHKTQPAMTTADTKTVILADQNKPPNPLHVVIPAVVTTVLGGVPGIIAAAAGEGLKRAGGALVNGALGWFSKRGVK